MSHHRNPHVLLTASMRNVLQRMERAGHPPFYMLSPAQARAAYIAGSGVLELPAQQLQRVESFTIPARDGFDIPVRLYAPGGGALPVLVYFHGGGFTIGNITTHDALCRRLAHLAQCAVLSVDYRLAPEFKFPIAHEDAWDAVQWVAREGKNHGLDGMRMAVGGDSAGGTLSAACAIEARNAGLSLALQLLIYPGCAGHQNTESHSTYAKGFVLNEASITYFFTHYLRSPADRDDWRFAPLDGKTETGEVVDLAGVAPVWMGLAECDPLADEGVAYADRLRMAGVSVDLDIYRGVVHEFIKMGRAIPEAAQAHADAANALKNAFNP
jgi:acetyl esterase